MPTVHHWWDVQSKQTRQTKHSCQIEVRGTHVNLVYYNVKQVLCAYSFLHVTVVHVRIEDEHTDTYTYKRPRPHTLPGGRS
jgi:hypothetical protein